MPDNNPSFSILIPSWNNLAYLKLCVRSIRQHSISDHQIIVHVNEGSDGTTEWLKKENIEFTFSEKNIGICKAMNQSFKLAKHEWIVYMNDDMYVLPNWDSALIEMIEKLKTDILMLSSTMIEPKITSNQCVIHADFGISIENFREQELLVSFPSFKKKNWSGSQWPPNMVHRKMWEKIGGFSEEFSPGLYSDPDFAMKMWKTGCRIFIGVGNSLVYHFQSKSTGKVKKNNGRLQFAKKWGIMSSAFGKHYLHMGEEYSGRLQEPNLIQLIPGRIKAKLHKMFNTHNET